VGRGSDWAFGGITNPQCVQVTQFQLLLGAIANAVAVATAA